MERLGRMCPDCYVLAGTANSVSASDSGSYSGDEIPPEGPHCFDRSKNYGSLSCGHSDLRAFRVAIASIWFALAHVSGLASDTTTAPALGRRFHSNRLVARPPSILGRACLP